MGTFSCQEKPTPTGTNTTRRTSVEILPPHTNYPAAFDGQTRIDAVKTKTPYEVKVIAQNLGKPWGIVELPDTRLLITNKSGDLILMTNTGEKKQVIKGLPKVDSRGQGGLLDIALDPDFVNNNMIYWSFSEPADNGNHTAVAKGRLNMNSSKVEGVKVIFRALPSYNGTLHYGSRLAFDKDGYLYVSTGERSDKVTRALAQKTDNYLGKISRITTEGKAAPGNPFAGKQGYKEELYAYGFRNPQGLAFDAKGQLWEVEFGPQGGDEVNLVKAGANYGWGDVTYGLEYTGDKVGKGLTSKQGTEQPVYYWDPSVSPSGLDFYRGSIEEWKGNMIIGCLSGQHIVRLVIEGNKVVGEERLLERENERFRDILSTSDGHLYSITDSGKLYRISKK